MSVSCRQFPVRRAARRGPWAASLASASLFILSAAAAQDSAPPEAAQRGAGQNGAGRPAHVHEPLRVEPDLSWQTLIGDTMAGYPSVASVEARAAEAGVLTERGARWLAGAPVLYFGYLTDAPLDRLGQREYDAAVELPLWRAGQRTAARSVGQFATAESAAARGALRWQVAGLLRSSLWDINEAANEVERARESLGVAAQLAQAVERRNAAGDLPLRDVLLARSAMLDKRVDLIEAQARLLDAERAYRSLTGLDARPADVSEPLTQTEDFDEHHPLLALANAEIDRTRAELEFVDRQVRGNPVLSIGPHRQRDPLGTLYSNSLTVAVTVPVGGKSRRATSADRARAQRALTDAEARRAALERQLDLDLHEAEHTLLVVEQSLDVADRRAELAQRQWRMGQTAFAQGEIELRELLRLQDAALADVRELRRLRIARQRTIAELNQAVGEVP
jgi:cobalt-zinc-cadmium efflux system outer membrane protein